MTEKPKLYLMPGLGDPGFSFTQLKATGLEFEVLNWLIPKKRENYLKYLHRMAASIDTSKPFYLGGVSFGGMAAVKMTEFLKPEKLILISTVKENSEFPKGFRFFKFVPVQGLFPAKPLKRTILKLVLKTNKTLGTEGSQHISQYIGQSNPALLRWSLIHGPRWSKKKAPAEVFHFHGNMDAIFPIRKIKNPIVVEGGDHFLVVKKANELAKMIREVLDN